METCDNAWETRPTSPSRPVQVGVVLRIRAHQTAFRRDNIDGSNFFARPTPALAEVSKFKSKKKSNAPEGEPWTQYPSVPTHAALE